jgi:hypothetical protein
VQSLYCPRVVAAVAQRLPQSVTFGSHKDGPIMSPSLGPLDYGGHGFKRLCGIEIAGIG